VESANLIGSVEKNFSVIGPSFTVYDASDEPLCNIYGPNISGCCMYKEAQFQVMNDDGQSQNAENVERKHAVTFSNHAVSSRFPI
jgi:hypothetical protein